MIIDLLLMHGCGVVVVVVVDVDVEVEVVVESAVADAVELFAEVVALEVPLLRFYPFFHPFY